MTPFEVAIIQPDEVDRVRRDMLAFYATDDGRAELEQLIGKRDADQAAIDDVVRRAVEEACDGLLFKNDKYQVQVREARVGEGWVRMLHLSIKRLDKEPIHDFRDLQEIKNQLVGPEHEAVELYPAESRLVDSANQFHLFCLADPNLKFPFGFWTRFVTEKTGGCRAKQRPF